MHEILFLGMEYSGQIFEISFFAKKRRKFQNLCKESEEIVKEKNENSNCFFNIELKDLIIYFSFLWLMETIVDQKPLFGIFFTIFIVVLYDIFLEKIQIWNFFHNIGNFSSK